MKRNYFLFVSSAKGHDLRVALTSELQHSNSDTTRKIKQVLTELHGIGELEKGFSRQMVLSRSELGLVRTIISKHELGIEVDSI